MKWNPGWWTLIHLCIIDSHEEKNGFEMDPWLSGLVMKDISLITFEQKSHENF